MSRRKRPTDLELHRAAHHANNRTGHLKRIDMLTDEEKRLVFEDMQHASVEAASIEGGPKSDEFSRIFRDTLIDWGIMCPHPEHYVTRPQGTTRWFHCRLCGCPVVGVDRG